MAAMAALSGGAPETARRWLDVAQLGRRDWRRSAKAAPCPTPRPVAQVVACCLKGEVLTAAISAKPPSPPPCR